MNHRKPPPRRTSRRTAVAGRRRITATRGTRRSPAARTRRGARTAGRRLPLIIGGLAALVVAIAVGLTTMGGITGVIPEANSGTTVSFRLLFTAPTANDTPISLPASIRDTLSQLADAHESVAITRIDGDGSVETYTVDMTPRTGENPSDPPLTVPERSIEKTQEKIADIERELNTPSSSGGRSLFKGLTRADFTGTPVAIVSSLIDLSSPADFRTLNWSTDPAEVVAVADGALGDIGAPVTFVVVPTGGEQPQLGAEDKAYAKEFWATVLRSANAEEVTFVDAVADPEAPERDAPATAVVEPQPLPDTPITAEPDPKRPADPTAASCTIGGSYFAWASPYLLDRDLTVHNLSACIEEALASCATFEVHGWASYEGELTPDGQPTHNDQGNQDLSDQRVATVVALLTAEFGVRLDQIGMQKGHGNLDLPVPAEPSSPENRVVRITYTTTPAGCDGDGR